MACCCELQDTLDVEVTQDALLDVEIGGSAGVLLQAKSVEVTENGTSVVAPDDGFDGLKSVEINTNVPKRFECGDATFSPPASGATSISISQQLKTLNASCWDTSRVTNMANMFSGFSYLQSLDVSGWDTSSVTNMGAMFNGCRSLQSLDVSGWDTSSVTTMVEMFYKCSYLQQLDVSGWDTSKVTNMKNMFTNCNSLQNIDVSKLDTSNVTNMSELFAICYALKYIDVSNWNTSKVKNMESIFAFCESLQNIDISKWDTSSCTSMVALFRACTSLKSVDLSGFDVSNITSFLLFFDGCKSLRTIIGDKTLQDVENGTVALRGTKVNIQTKSSPLRFSSILALANGLADLTGGTAQTLTISANSYNNMYNDDDTAPAADLIAERQARIAAICAAKNWNFAH